MRPTLLISSAVVVVLTLGMLIILASHGYHDSFIGHKEGFATSRFLPGQPGYLLIQLVVGLVAAMLTFLRVLSPQVKGIKTMAAVLALVAIVVAFADLFWLSVLFGLHNMLFLWSVRARGPIT